MLLPKKSGTLLAVILASSVVWPCWALPADNGKGKQISDKRPDQKPSTPPPSLAGTANPPVTPEMKPSDPNASPPGAPRKTETPKEIIAQFGSWLEKSTDNLLAIREQNIYVDEGKSTANRMAADWVFPPNPKQNKKGLIVELKVESSRQTKDLFVASVVRDQVKISGSLLPKYADYNKAVFAIAWTPETVTALEAKNMLLYKPFKGVPSKKHPENILRFYYWNGVNPNSKQKSSSTDINPTDTPTHGSSKNNPNPGEKEASPSRQGSQIDPNPGKKSVGDKAKESAKNVLAKLPHRKKKGEK